MNIWENTVLTEKGRNLLAKLVAGNSLNITKAMTGTGYVTPGLLSRQTAVSGPKQALAFAPVSYQETGKCAVTCTLKNDGLTGGYITKQIGLYATDPDDGEILFLISQSPSDKGVEVPSASEMPGYAAEWTFYLQYGQADGVNVTVDPSNTVSSAAMEAYVAVALSNLTAKDVGAIRTYTSFEDIGLSNTDFIPEDVIANLRKIYLALKDYDELMCYISSSETPNFYASTAAKIEEDLGLSSTNKQSIKFRRMYYSLEVDICALSTSHYQNRYSCVFRYMSDGGYISQLIYTRNYPGFVSKEGDTITGKIKYKGGAGAIGSASDDIAFRIDGGISYTSGAFLALHGKDNANHPGMFQLTANDGENRGDMWGYPDGRLTWQGKSIFHEGNKSLIKPEDIGASATGHEHTKSEISDFPTSMTPTSHNQAASTITAGTFGGQVVAKSGAQAVGTSLLRNSKIVSADTDPSNNGEINWTYK